MTRLLPALVFCALIHSAARGQVSGDTLLPAHVPWVLCAGGGVHYNSSTLYNELFAALWQGGYVSRDLRSRSGDALREVNRAGYGIHADLEWTGSNVLFAGRWRPAAVLSTRDVMGMRFAPDLYRIAFFGNAPYAGREARSGPWNFTRTRYQSLGFGMEHTASRSFIRADVLLGQSFAQARVERADLFTGEDGEVLRADLKGEYLLSDTAGSGFGRNNGAGMAVSGTWNFTPDGSRSTVDIGVEHFGFIRWNANGLRASRDTVIEFSGFTAASIADLGDALRGTENLLDSFGLAPVRGAFTTFTPFRVHARWTRPLASLWSVQAEVQQVNVPGYVPRVLLGTYRVSPNGRWMYTTALMYGGFGGAQWMVGGRVRVAPWLYVETATPNMPGFLLGRTRGMGLSFRITTVFN
jgi:hypothetical protein